jgi:ParB family chromosome partitioning protein
MTTQHITLIPIHEIRVVNPRSRNRIKFHNIVSSISTVGLKRPITVHQRALEEDGTRYDLVCGQGRLEAVRDLAGC